MTLETNLQNKVTLNIIKEGEVWIVDVYKNLVVSDLINMAIAHFHDPKDCHNLSVKYKFISVPQNKTLNFQSTIEEEEVKNNEELLLVPIISLSGSTQKELLLHDIKGPSQEEITSATANLTNKNPAQDVPTWHCQEDMQSEISKILYSFVEASAKILALRPDANIIFDGITARINAQIKQEIDKNAVKYLMDLGFTEFQANYALRLKKNRQIESMEWLLENHSSLKERADESDKPFPPISDVLNVDNPLYKIKQLLQDIQTFHQRYFEPNFRATKNLTEMGFNPEDVFEALRVANNDELTACEWLCGERGSDITGQSMSLDPDSQLFKVVMKNPVIQLGLFNPKIMLAFLLILESPASMGLWLNDVDAAPVLGQIFKIYHTEKHMIMVNQQMELMRKQQLHTRQTSDVRRQ